MFDHCVGCGVYSEDSLIQDGTGDGGDYGVPMIRQKISKI